MKHKLDTFVNFPIHDFDLTNYVANKNNTRRQIYELYALTNHYGGMGSGHYTAHIKVTIFFLVSCFMSFIFLFLHVIKFLCQSSNLLIYIIHIGNALLFWWLVSC